MKLRFNLVNLISHISPLFTLEYQIYSPKFGNVIFSTVCGCSSRVTLLRYFCMFSVPFCRHKMQDFRDARQSSWKVPKKLTKIMRKNIHKIRVWNIRVKMRDLGDARQSASKFSVFDPIVHRIFSIGKWWQIRFFFSNHFSTAPLPLTINHFTFEMIPVATSNSSTDIWFFLVHIKSIFGHIFLLFCHSYYLTISPLK